MSDGGVGTVRARGRKAASVVAFPDPVRARRAELLGSLRVLERALGSPIGCPDWADRVGDALRRLEDAFDDHLHMTEASGGLFDEILTDAPRLEGRVRALREEHRELEEAIARSLEGVTTVQEPVQAEPIRDELLLLLGRLVRHRHRGSDLVYEAYGVDLGGAGD